MNLLQRQTDRQTERERGGGGGGGGYRERVRRKERWIRQKGHTYTNKKVVRQSKRELPYSLVFKRMRLFGKQQEICA